MAASNSPLKPYANARLLAEGVGTVTQVNGRWVETASNYYLVKLFMKRVQYSGVSSGSVRVPLPSQLGGNMMPGASGDVYYYRGYALESAVVAENWNIESDSEAGLTWQQVSEQPQWLLPDSVVTFRLGNDPVMPSAIIQRSSGTFGGAGIDQILYKEMGGVELQLSGGQIQA